MKRSKTLAALILGAMLLAKAPAANTPAAPAAPVPPSALPVPVKLEILPNDIKLLTKRGEQRFIVVASFADGITRDVTSEAKIRLTNPAVVKIENSIL